MNKIGVDIVEIIRMKNFINNFKFMSKIFSLMEIEFFSGFKNEGKLLSSLAGNFAAKEAFLKVIEDDFYKFKFKEISVLRKSNGAPYYFFEGGVKDVVCKKNLIFNVSISHCKDFAIAIALCEKL